MPPTTATPGVGLCGDAPFDPAGGSQGQGATTHLALQLFNGRFVAPSTRLESHNLRTGAFEQPNYSNAVVASRDTNVSPKEAYDVISSRALPPPVQGGRTAAV